MQSPLRCFNRVMRCTVSLGRLRGRVARPASLRVNLAKTLAQTLVMWALFLFLGPLLAFAIEGLVGADEWRFASAMWRAFGSALFIGGWLLAWWSAWIMISRGDGTPLPLDCPRRLVITGVYRYVRNPMAMGSLAQGVAIGLFCGSPLVVFYALAGVFVWNCGARRWEERDLAERFGADYTHYRDCVRCWIPRLHPYAPPRAD